MLALGGMTLAFAAAALLARDRSAGAARTPRTADTTVHSRGFVRELEREKQLVLKAIKEIELDYQMRKIAERDYREMVERYRNRAMRLICELDAGGDFRGLIEKELKLRLELPVAEPSPATGAAAAQRERAGGGRAANLRRLQDRKRPGREVLQIMRRKALDRAPARGAAAGGAGRGRAAHDEGRRAAACRTCRRSSGGRSPTAACRPARSAYASRARCPPTRSRASEVSAIIKNAGGDLRRRALKTDDSGRVLFEGMAPGDEFRAEVNVDGEQLQTDDVHDARRRAASARC